MRVEKTVLAERIGRRLERRLEEGLVEEVRGLLEGGLPVERLHSLGLEYREVGAYLSGSKSYDRMVMDLRRGIELFAKRQQTWFRGMARRGLSVTWIDAGDSAAVLALLGERFPRH